MVMGRHISVSFSLPCHRRQNHDEFTTRISRAASPYTLTKTDILTKEEDLF
jgi:hypothetical protein